MRNAILTLILIVSSAAAANPYIPQGTHVRQLLFEGWGGSYIESLYVRDLGTVRFDFCQRESFNSHFKKCNRLHRRTVLIRDLGFYQPYLIAELKEVRAVLAAELDQNFFSRLLGGSSEDRSVRALDKMIFEIEQESLERWLWLREIPRGIPSVATGRVSTKVAESFQRAFDLTPPTPPKPTEPGVLIGSGYWN